MTPPLEPPTELVDVVLTLATALRELPLAELTVLAWVAHGLLLGHDRFGPLYAGKRAWAREAAEELRDRCIYDLADALERAGLLPAKEDK